MIDMCPVNPKSIFITSFIILISAVHPRTVRQKMFVHFLTDETVVVIVGRLAYKVRTVWLFDTSSCACVVDYAF